ncbi:MAG TPA: DUF3761 domain-containing protein [Acidimicrobiia bacterium]
MAGTPAGWYADPLARHEHRYWDGSAWTENVATAGMASTDPLDAGAEPTVQQEPVDGSAPGAAVPMVTTSNRRTGWRALPVWAWAVVGAIVLFVGIGAAGAATGGNDSSTTHHAPAASSSVPSTHALVTSTTTSTTTTTTVPPTTTTTVYVPPPTAPPATFAPAPPPVSCPNGSYVNSSGNTVCSPYTPPGGGAPPGATAKCTDGTYSSSQHRSGTCSGHGGVAQWL